MTGDGPAVYPKRVERIRRLHALAGIVPLPIFLVVHAFEVSAAPFGRSAFEDRVLGSAAPVASMLVEALLVLGPLLLHVVLGLRIYFADRTKEASGMAVVGDQTPSKDALVSPMLPVIRGTGFIGAAFVVYHVSHTWALKLEPGYTAGVAYEVLRESIGLPLVMLLYVGGVTAVVFHVAFAIPLALERLGIQLGSIAVRRLRGFLAAVAVVIFVVFVNSLSHFAVGRSLFFGAIPEPEHRKSTD